MSTEQAPDSCPFCGAGITVMSDGRQCRASNGDWVAFTCLTSWHRGHPTPRNLQSRPCESFERDRLTRERDEAREQLEICRARSNEKDIRIEDLKARLQLAQDDLSMRIKEVEKVERERDQLLARVKRLEEAGDKLNDALRWHQKHNPASHGWISAKEAKP